MVFEWTITAGVGLMVGISLGVLVQLRYVVLMDKKIEHILERVARIELRTEHEVIQALSKKLKLKKGRTVSRAKKKAKKRRK